MSNEKPTNGELAIMLKALKEHGDEKHRVVSEYMKDIRDLVRDNTIHVDNLKAEVASMKHDFNEHKREMQRETESLQTRVGKVEERVGFFNTWYAKILGGVMVLGAAISVPNLVTTILEALK